jgi:hypothetical protein
MAQIAGQEQWHLDKRVPIGIILALLVQTITFFTIAAAWKTSVDGRIERLEELASDSSKQGDRILILEQQLRYIVESLSRIEKKLDIVESGKTK